VTQAENDENNFNVWVCCGQQFEQREVVEHLQSVHGIQPPIQAQRKMTGHLDAAGWFQSNYEWSIGELKLHQAVRMERAKDDFMRFTGEEEENE
jgi:hypothetical protein